VSTCVEHGCDDGAENRSPRHAVAHPVFKNLCAFHGMHRQVSVSYADEGRCALTDDIDRIKSPNGSITRVQGSVISALKYLRHEREDKGVLHSH
jgi:hypothetical protein